MRLGVGAALVDGSLVPGDVEVADGRIAGVGLSSAERNAASPLPGFVDLQVNGFAGVDFFSADTDGLSQSGRGACSQCGVTAYQPTFITSPEDELTAALQEVPQNGSVAAHHRCASRGPVHLGASGSARILPRRGAIPTVSCLERLLAAGPVSHVTLAPELPGAYELMELLRKRGVTVSCGHSNATAAEARDAFSRGAKTVTHIFNAMRPFAAREPGLAGAALVSGDVVVQVILDGVHLADDTARLVWQAAAGRVALVTDATAAAGAGDGSYTIAGVDFEVENGVARSADRVLAGSTVPMIEAVRNLVHLGAPIEAALSAASEVPARIAGRPELGTLKPGSVADVVVVDDSLEIVRVLVGGDDATG